ncbi:hypothetical protein [Nocardia sp. AG03]|uniref:hypothetical protein n=1 Tax=Nocardia sp. AG03 TaxID=3025312 RepID=UPI002418691A|nr:hypothetical protein [Nocardia sp. AG03]
MRKIIYYASATVSLILSISGCASGNDVHPEATTAIQPTDLWSLISATTAQSPLTNEKINALYNTRLEGTGRRDIGPVVAVGGIPIEEVTSVSRPDGTWAFTHLEIDEPRCISLDEVKTHYPDIEKTSMPRGHSLEERYVWTSWQPWGTLNCGFPERDYCLAGFALYTEDEYTRRPYPSS